MPTANPAFYFARLRRLARAHGGEVLSSAYVNDFTKLRYRCAEGHEWSAAPGHVKSGKWCPKCSLARAGALRRAEGEKRLKRAVARRRGVILSTAYVNSQSKLLYRCRDGHEWSAAPASIVQGRWCPSCAREKMHVTSRKWTKATIARIQWIARQNGGRALARTYRNARGTVECRCARGHSWMARVASIDEGTWCPQCKQQSVLDRARAQALSLGGTCLSESCRNTRSVLEWQCIAGHRWRGPAHLVLSGIWCRKCRRTEAGTLEQMQRIARERGGRCLSARYVDAESALSWRCREGHEWSAEPGSVIQGSWCRRCNRGYGRSRRRLSIEIMRDMARERGGVCLSAKYDGIYDRLRWRCAKGHEWVTAANNVRRGGWCPRCSHSILGTLDGLRAHAISFGGRCLTRAWNNHKEPLAFECAKGHRFKQIANVLKSGVWCPDCARRSVHPTGAVKARSAKMLATRGR